ncbi:MAG: 5-formyltetrahydrofolate cyclo-ligase [Gammaproteobacteria bacterium]
MGHRDTKQQKSEIRAQLKQIRTAIPAGTRQVHTKNITSRLLSLDELTAAQTIFIYISYASEVGTHNLIKHFLGQGKTLAVPKIIDSDHMIAVAFTRWGDLELGKLGILTPPDTEPFPANFDVAISPGLGFTSAGHRMGFGRGYYDKWFANNKVGMKLALAFEAQLLDDLPIDETDVPMDIIVTEQRVIRSHSGNNSCC